MAGPPEFTASEPAQRYVWRAVRPELSPQRLSMVVGTVGVLAVLVAVQPWPSWLSCASAVGTVRASPLFPGAIGVCLPRPGTTRPDRAVSPSRSRRAGHEAG